MFESVSGLRVFFDKILSHFRSCHRSVSLMCIAPLTTHVPSRAQAQKMCMQYLAPGLPFVPESFSVTAERAHLFNASMLQYPT